MSTSTGSPSRAARAAAAVLAAAVTWGCGTAAATPPLREGPVEAMTLLDRWDLPGARRALAAIPATGDPALRWLRAMTAFYGGDYEEALGLLPPESPEGGGEGEGDAHMGRLVRDTLELTRKLARRESEHFVVFYDEERDWVLAAPALEVLERAYAALGEWLGHYPGEKVRVEIIPSAASFERVSSLARREIETSGAIGICKFNKIMLLTPRALLQGYRWRDSLVHEYIHYLLVTLSSNRAPIWVQEGVARYGETMWRSPAGSRLSLADESLLAKALREGGLVPFSSMDPSLVKLPTMAHVRLAFAQCALAVDFLLGTWQREGLRNLLKALGRAGVRDGADLALREALGVSLAQFERQWKEDLAARKLREVPGLAVPEFRIAGGGGEEAEEWELASWQPLEAQKHLRLGDMLRARGRRDGALEEYRRSLEIAPASPFALNRLARVLVELSRDTEAEAPLRRAVQVYPDYPTSYALLGRLLAALGRPGEAGEYLREYLEINPFDPYVWRDLGTLMGAMGEKEEARRCAETALRLDPSGGGVGPAPGKDR